KPAKGREVVLYAVWGLEVRSATAIDALVRILAEPSGSLEVSPNVSVPKVQYGASLVSVRFALLRELIKHASEADLALGMSARLGMAPKLTSHGAGLLRVMGLSDPQVRMAQRLLDGRHPLDEVLHNGIGVRSSWQVIYLEQLLGGLTWGEPPH